MECSRGQYLLHAAQFPKHCPPRLAWWPGSAWGTVVVTFSATMRQAQRWALYTHNAFNLYQKKHLWSSSSLLLLSVYYRGAQDAMGKNCKLSHPVWKRQSWDAHPCCPHHSDRDYVCRIACGQPCLIYKWGNTSRCKIEGKVWSCRHLGALFLNNFGGSILFLKFTFIFYQVLLINYQNPEHRITEHLN